jgi:hypothetical protein
MKKSIVGLLLVLFTSLAWALPTVQQVEAATKQGHYAQAESMMAEVVAAKPESAKAHYIYAELLAHNANFRKASEEAARAKALDPDVRFTDPQKFADFQALLSRELNPAPRAQTSGASSAPAYRTAPAVAPAERPASSSGIPGWVWLAGLALLAVVLWRGFSRSRDAGAAAMAPAGMPAGYGPGGMNPGPAYGPAPYGPAPYGPQAGGGSGLLGTGLAVGAGVAGGMLLDEMLHRRNEGGSIVHDGGGVNNQIGGFDPAGYRPSSDDQAASELESRPIDFGSGGDWDSGGDSGGGDSGGGGWD